MILANIKQQVVARINALIKYRFVRNAGGLSVANFIAQGVGLTSMIVMGRFYSPDSIGVLGVFIATSAIIGVMSLLSYQQAVPSIKNKDELHMVTATLLVLSGLTTIVVLVLSSIFEYRYSAALALVVGLQATMQVADMINIRDENIRRLAWARISTAALYLVALTITLTRAESPTNLVLAQVFAVAIVASVYLYISILQNVLRERHFAGFGWIELRKVLRNYADFSIFLAPSQLFFVLTYQLPIIIIERYMGAALSAQYLITLRFCMNPVSTIGNAVAQTYHGKLAYAVRTKSVDGYTQFLRLNKGLIIISSVTTAGIFLFFPGLIRLLLGPNWELAGQLVRIMAPLYGFMLLAMPLSVVFLVCKKQKYVLKNQFAGFVISLISFTFAVIQDDIVGGIVIFTVLGIIRYLFIYSKEKQVFREHLILD